MEYPSYEMFGVSKCLGCKYYLAGIYHDDEGNYRSCRTHCPRTEHGIEQIECKIKFLDEDITKLKEQIKELVMKKAYLEIYLNEHADDMRMQSRSKLREGTEGWSIGLVPIYIQKRMPYYFYYKLYEED